MSTTLRRFARAVFLVALIVSASMVAQSYADPTEVDVDAQFDSARDGTLASEQWSTSRVDRATDGGRNLTVVATQGFYVSDERAELAAFTGNGTVVYYNDSYRVYFDVDPVPDERYTVEYVASKHYEAAECTEFDSERCTRNVVARTNMTTGDHEVVYAEKTPRIYSARWHDVDRLNETHVVVADIVEDSVFAVDTRDGDVAWEWHASENYTREQGGQGGDWTHVNDVELLDDGRVMVSLRNMDSAIFLNVSGGEATMDESWTLGEDDDYETMHEQHNPDYIPAERGGPAVVVADSENGRIIEFQRTDGGEASDASRASSDSSDGEWTRTWEWRDARLQWPRDADRLPDGNTLVVDTHGDRIAEVDPSDRVVWTANVGMPYDVERLGTGDESAGGQSAQRLGLGDNGSVAADGDSRSAVDAFWIELKKVTPGLIANGLLYISPSWVRFTDLAFGALALLTGLTWGTAEFYWSGRTLRGTAASGADRVRALFQTIGRRLSGQ